MAVPLVRQPPQNNESSTRIKRAAESEPEGRSALLPGPPAREVEMKIPRGMPVLPGGRRMPPLPVRLRESLEPLRRSLAPLRRSLAPLRRSLAPFLGKAANETDASEAEETDASEVDADEAALTPKRRWPLVALLLVILAAGAAVAYVLAGRG